VLGLILLAGCSGGSTAPLSNGEQAAPRPGMATVEWRAPVRISAVNGEAIADPAGRGPALQLDPGEHEFRYEVIYGGSVMWCGAFHGTSGSLAAALTAGHRYRIGSYNDNWNCVIAVWLEDMTTNELVHGMAPRSLGLTPRQPPPPDAEPIQDPGPRFAAVESRAAGGDAVAAYELGLWYLLGDPPLSRPNEAMAVTWLERAAAGGHESANAALQRLR
jgi:hypothetical protein